MKILYQELVFIDEKYQNICEQICVDNEDDQGMRLDKLMGIYYIEYCEVFVLENYFNKFFFLLVNFN